MIQRPDSCIGCPLHTKSTPGFVPDAVARHQRYVLVAEAPGRNEIDQGKPMVGKAGHVLHNWLLHAVLPLKLAWERGEVTIANTLRCLPNEIQGRAYPRGEEKTQAEEHCRQYDTWRTLPYETVVLLGEHAQRYWFKDELEAEDVSDRRLGHEVKGVMGRIGRVYERDGRRWVFAPHPAFILRQPALVEHGQAALKIAANIDKIVEVEYTNWDEAMHQMQANKTA